MNKLHLKPAKSEDKNQLRKMLDIYLNELSVYGAFDKTYPHFDLYWTEKNRWPYLILLGDKIIGFSFVTKHSPFGNETDFFLAEFYIDPDHRSSGYGFETIQKTLVKHRGQWELSFFEKNKTAAAFWPAIIGKCDVENIERSKFKKVSILRFSNN